MDNRTEYYTPIEYSNIPDPEPAQEAFAEDPELFGAQELSLDGVLDEYNEHLLAAPTLEDEDKKAALPQNNPSVTAAAAAFSIIAVLAFFSAALVLSPQETPAPAPSVSVELPPPPPQPDSTPPTPVSSSSITEPAPLPSAQVEVIFCLDGGRVGNETEDIYVGISRGDSVTPPPDVIKDGYIFEDWVTARGGVVSAQFSQVNESFTAYAKWRKGDALVSYENAPTAVFRYRWSVDEFHPFAYILWNFQTTGGYIDWQAYDQNGAPLGSGGRIVGKDGVVTADDYEFPISPMLDNGLYPKGCTLRLTPYAYDETGEISYAPAVMELPYFEAEAMMDGDNLIPIISTNIGFYFEHSYNSLNFSPQGDQQLRITGDMVPLEGEKVALKIDVLTS